MRACGQKRARVDRPSPVSRSVSDEPAAFVAPRSGRAANCFAIEAIKGHHIIFEIVEESTGLVVFSTRMGREAFQTLVLTGGPSGTVYRVNLVSADEADARITIRFIDHPTF